MDLGNKFVCLRGFNVLLTANVDTRSIKGRKDRGEEKGEIRVILPSKFHHMRNDAQSYPYMWCWQAQATQQ